MTLAEQYQAFLASPSSGALADGASLHYITTLTSINEPAPIIKHLSVQEKLLKKKNQKVLSAVEGGNGLSVDVETTIEFVSSGGAYLPGLDDNFVADRVVTFPMVHIVHFDSAQKITQIRLYWDQGSLLKQMDVIGARARNWPIRDGKEQSRLIASTSAYASQAPQSTASSRRSTASRGAGADDVTITERPASSQSSTSNAMNDPHATLSLFQPRDLNQESESPSRPIAPRAQSAKPPPREYSELFVGENPGTPTPGENGERIPVKLGGGKNYKPSRLFDNEEETAPTPLSVKTNAKKYNHFEFGNGEDDATPKVVKSTRSKHMSQWDFEDFVTPEKTNPKILGQQVRHFGWSDDEDEGSPVRRPIVHKERPDSHAHFEFADDGTPQADRKPPPTKGGKQNKGLGLYKDHVTNSISDDDEGTPTAGDAKRPLGDVTTHIKNENRKKDFGSQWEMRDDSPGPEHTSFAKTRPTKVSEDRQKVVKGMDANWGMYEESPEQAKKENLDVTSRGIKTSGNGMGGRKGTKAWHIGEGGSDDDEQQSFARPASKSSSRAHATTESKSFWDF